jgi:predicted RNase H-like nuclease (RuvC/YqgF family)
VQEQQEMIDQLKKSNQSLLQIIETMQDKVTELESKIQK